MSAFVVLETDFRHKKTAVREAVFLRLKE